MAIELYPNQFIGGSESVLKAGSAPVENGALTIGLIASSLAIVIGQKIESLKEETFLHRLGRRDQPVLRIRLFRGIRKEITHLQKQRFKNENKGAATKGKQ